MKRATYGEMRLALEWLLTDLSVLAGDRVGESGLACCDYIRTAAAAARELVDQLELAGKGKQEPLLAFPSPADCLADLEGKRQ